MYLRNQKNKKLNDKKTPKPLKATIYSKIKNKQRKSKEKDSLIHNQKIQSKGILRKQEILQNILIFTKEQTKEIEKYFLKQVGNVSMTNLNAVDSTKPNTSEALADDRTKIKKNEFDLINQYLDCSRITAFNNYMSEKDLPKFNFFKQESETKIQNKSKEFSLTESIGKKEKKDDEKFSIDYLVKKFREPFEKNKMIFLKRSQMIRKELMEVYQSNFSESPQSEVSNKKNFVDCEIQTSMIYNFEQINNELVTKLSDDDKIQNKLINQLASNVQVDSPDILIQNEFPKSESDSITKNVSLKNKVAIRDLKLEDLYYD